MSNELAPGAGASVDPNSPLLGHPPKSGLFVPLPPGLLAGPATPFGASAQSGQLPDPCDPGPMYGKPAGAASVPVASVPVVSPVGPENAPALTGFRVSQNSARRPAPAPRTRARLCCLSWSRSIYAPVVALPFRPGFAKD